MTTTSISVTSFVTALRLLVKPLSTGVACGLTKSHNVYYEIVMIESKNY